MPPLNTFVVIDEVENRNICHCIFTKLLLRSDRLTLNGPSSSEGEYKC